jgi:hypothetical protein
LHGKEIFSIYYAIIQMLKSLRAVLEPPNCAGIVKWANADSIDIDGENGDRLKGIISIFS